MKYIFDLDGTLCSQQKSGNYYKAEPYTKRIEYVNALYLSGHDITIWTARGMSTGRLKALSLWFLTWRQLRKWKVKYTKLRMMKPAYDFWVDDKAYQDVDFF